MRYKKQIKQVPPLHAAARPPVYQGRPVMLSVFVAEAVDRHARLEEQLRRRHLHFGELSNLYNIIVDWFITYLY